MKFYHMSEFTDCNNQNIHLRQGEITAEEFIQYAKTFNENVDFGVLAIEHVDAETNTIYFYSDIV